MKISDLQFDFPEELISKEPSRPTRVMWSDCVHEKWQAPVEITKSELLQKIPAGDLLVVNNTKVIKSRVFAKEIAGDLEILFLRETIAKENGSFEWEVLFPSKKYAVGSVVELPKALGLAPKMTLIEKGRPQNVSVDVKLSPEYFEAVGELPLPPYIQKAREKRHTVDEDSRWYQTAWARSTGSLASPTASLHFSADDISELRARGVQVCELTLHVGLGTFLPVTTEDLNDHKMHSEFVEIPASTWDSVARTMNSSSRVWALGTTVARALESAAIEKLPRHTDGSFKGETDILIQPGHKWRVVGGLLTNFHQPESTLLALVASFSDLQTVKDAYQWAIENKFKLFSYGDLTAWKR